MFKSEPIHIIRIGFDVILLCITITAWILVHYLIQPPKAGFYCNDYSIALKYKDSTVTNVALIIICTLIPIVIICGTEFIRKYYSYFKQTAIINENGTTTKSSSFFIYKINVFRKSIDIPDILGNIYITLGSYFFGLLIVQFLTNLAKFTIGRLRPNYIDVCKPRYLHMLQGTQDCLFKKFYELDVDYVCDGTDKKRLDDAVLSFPSGHASTAFYTMIFLILYVRYAWRCERKRQNCGFGIVFFQCILFSLAFFTALSRVVDNKHHVTDVLAGSILGISFAIIVFYLFTEFFSKKSFRNDFISLHRLSSTDEENPDYRRPYQQTQQIFNQQQRPVSNNILIENL